MKNKNRKKNNTKSNIIVFLFVLMILSFLYQIFSIINTINQTREVQNKINEVNKETKKYKEQNKNLEKSDYAKSFLRDKYYSKENEILYVFPE